MKKQLLIVFCELLFGCCAYAVETKHEVFGADHQLNRRKAVIKAQIEAGRDSKKMLSCKEGSILYAESFVTYEAKQQLLMDRLRLIEQELADMPEGSEKLENQRELLQEEIKAISEKKALLRFRKLDVAKKNDF
jgi:hypothetical protein